MTTRSVMKGKNKRPLETTLGRAPPAQKTPDLSHVRKPIKTSVFGLQNVLQLLETSTAEVRNYVSYECEIMYECRICRTIFRSLANFILHKRNYCTEKYTSMTVESCKANGNFVFDDGHVGVNEQCSRSSTPDSQRDTKNKKLISPVIDKLVEKHKIKEIAKEVLLEDLSVDNSEGSTAEYDGDMCLEKIKTTDSAVFQTMVKNFSVENKNSDFMKSQVMEIHSILDSDEAILGPDGKICHFETNKKRERSNLPKSDLVCTECDMKFSTRKTLTYHIKYKHNETRIVYPCPDCKELFANAWCVYRHLYKIHRKTSTQIRKLRDIIHNSAMRKDQQPVKKKEKKQVQEKTDDDNQWLKNVEGDNDIQMCGGCGKRFERKAALYSHSQMCIKRIAVCNNIKESNAKPKNEQDDKSKEKAGKSEKDMPVVKGSKKRKPSYIISYKVIEEGRTIDESDICNTQNENSEIIHPDISENESVHSSDVGGKVRDNGLHGRRQSHANSNHSTDDEEEQYSSIDALDTESMMDIIGIPSKSYQENILQQSDEVFKKSEELKSNIKNVLSESFEPRAGKSYVIGDKINQDPPHCINEALDDCVEIRGFSKNESGAFVEINEEASTLTISKQHTAVNENQTKNQYFESNIDTSETKLKNVYMGSEAKQELKQDPKVHHARIPVLDVDENYITDVNELTVIESTSETTDKIHNDVINYSMENKVNDDVNEMKENLSLNNFKKIEDVNENQYLELKYPLDVDPLREDVMENIQQQTETETQSFTGNPVVQILKDADYTSTKPGEKFTNLRLKECNASSKVSDTFTIDNDLVDATYYDSTDFSDKIVADVVTTDITTAVSIHENDTEYNNIRKQNVRPQNVENIVNLEPQSLLDKKQTICNNKTICKQKSDDIICSKKSSSKKSKKRRDNKLINKITDNHSLNVGENDSKHELCNTMENFAHVEDNYVSKLSQNKKHKLKKLETNKKTKNKIHCKQIKPLDDILLETNYKTGKVDDAEKKDSHHTSATLISNSSKDYLSSSKPYLENILKGDFEHDLIKNQTSATECIPTESNDVPFKDQILEHNLDNSLIALVRNECNVPQIFEQTDNEATNNDRDSSAIKSVMIGSNERSLAPSSEAHRNDCNIFPTEISILDNTVYKEASNGDIINLSFPDNAANNLPQNESIDISCNPTVTSDDTSLDTRYTDINIADTTYVNNDENEYICILDTITSSHEDESLILEDGANNVIINSDTNIENRGSQLFSDLETDENTNLKKNIEPLKESEIIKSDGKKSPDVIVINDDDSDTVQNEDNIEYIINSHSESDDYENEYHKELEEPHESVLKSPQILKRKRTLSLDYISQCSKKKAPRFGEDSECVSGDNDVNFISKAAPYMNQKNMSCVSCDLVFTKMPKLLWHMSQHFSWFRFQCSRCSYMSFNKFDCIDHAQTVHCISDNSLNCIVLPIPNWKTVLMSHEFCYITGAQDSQEEQSCSLTDVPEDINCGNEIDDATSFSEFIGATSNTKPEQQQSCLPLDANSSFFKAKSPQMAIEVSSCSSSGDDSDIQLQSTDKCIDIAQEVCTKTSVSELTNIKSLSKTVKNAKLTKSKVETNDLNNDQLPLNEDPSKSVRPVRNRVRSVKTLQSDFIYDLHDVKYKKPDILKKSISKTKSNSCKTLRVYSKTHADSDKVNTDPGDMHTEV